MMLNDVLLVIYNNQGQSEENFISTFDEFVQNFCMDEGAAYIENLRSVVCNANPGDWKGNHYERSDRSFDFRLCQGPEDLLKFLKGKYNDSVAEMEARNPGSSCCYEGWSWENDCDRFSPRAVEAVRNHIKNADNRDFIYELLDVLPDFPFTKVSVQSKKPSLDSMMQAADNVRVSYETVNFASAIDVER